jgi:hypothetical protein
LSWAASTSSIAHWTAEVSTLDLRHFQALRVGGRKRFRIFPVET